VVLTANVGGSDRVLLLDTGASWLALRSDIFQSIASDGRRQVPGSVSLVNGQSTTVVARLRTAAVGSADVTGPIAVSGTGIDDLLSSLTQELRHPIDGLLGAPFLQHFFLTVDYPARRIVLHPYTTDAHIVDEYHRVGLVLQSLQGASGRTYLVAGVLAGSDAASKGIRDNDILLSIDGTVLRPLDPQAVDQMLLGAVGSSHMLQFADRTLSVMVEDLLPLP